MKSKESGRGDSLCRGPEAGPFLKVLSMFEVKIPITFLHRVNSHLTLKLRESSFFPRSHTVEPVEWSLSPFLETYLVRQSLASEQCVQR